MQHVRERERERERERDQRTHVFKTAIGSSTIQKRLQMSHLSGDVVDIFKEKRDSCNPPFATSVDHHRSHWGVLPPTIVTIVGLGTYLVEP